MESQAEQNGADGNGDGKRQRPRSRPGGAADGAVEAAAIKLADSEGSERWQAVTVADWTQAKDIAEPPPVLWTESDRLWAWAAGKKLMFGHMALDPAAGAPTLDPQGPENKREVMGAHRAGNTMAQGFTTATRALHGGKGSAAVLSLCHSHSSAHHITAIALILSATNTCCHLYGCPQRPR
jgi:hypothetical protein